MALPATDAFTGSNGDDLPTYSGNWSAVTGTMRIYNNACRADNANDESCARWNADTPANDQMAQVTATALVAGQYVGAACRVSSSAVTYYGYYANANNGYLFKAVSGSETVLQSGLTIAAGNRVRVEAVGTSIRAFAAGALKAVQTDSAISSGFGGVCGYNNSSSAYSDDFICADFVSTRYWVGGSGNWSDAANHWAASSGGTAYSIYHPSRYTDVVFDSNSHSTDYAVTQNVTGYCKAMTWGNPASGSPTYTGSLAISLYGNLYLISGMTWSHDNVLAFYAIDGALTITSNSVKLTARALQITGPNSLQLQDDIEFNGTRLDGSLYSSGTLDANGFDFIVSEIGTSGRVSFAGSWTFYDLTIGPPTVGNQTQYVDFNANVTITNALTIKGYDAAGGRLIIKSNTRGTPRTITAASVTFENVDFEDIVGAGAASWDLSSITGGSGNCGGNSNITFTTGINLYWHVDGGDWTTAAKWFLATNGGGGAGRVPLPQDTAVFDANSFDSASQTITGVLNRLPAFNSSAVTNNPTVSMSNASGHKFYGSITVGTMTWSTYNTIYLNGRGSYTISGLNYAGNVIIDCITGTYTLAGALTVSGTKYFQLLTGTFDADVYDLTLTSFLCSGFTTRTLYMGSGTWNITNTGGQLTYAWNTEGTVTLYCETSTIKFTGALTQSDQSVWFGGKTYYIIWVANTGNYSMSWIDHALTCTEFKCDPGVWIKMGGNITAPTFTLVGASGNLIHFDPFYGGSPYTFAKTGGGTVSCDYLDLSYCTGSPADTFYAGTHSTNSGNNSGWIWGNLVSLTLNDVISSTQITDPSVVAGAAELGSVAWGHDTGVAEANTRDFTGNWTGTGFIQGSGDSEKILLASGEYMESETWNYGTGWVKILIDKYNSGLGTPSIQYKDGGTQANCEADSWHDYTGPFNCTGWLKIKALP